MSIDAPPPVMPPGDARIERTAGPPCREKNAEVGVGPRVRRGVGVVVEGGTVDGWMKSEHRALPAPIAKHALRRNAPGLVHAPGYAAGVFRPPRSV